MAKNKETGDTIKKISSYPFLPNIKDDKFQKMVAGIYNIVFNFESEIILSNKELYFVQNDMKEQILRKFNDFFAEEI